jgi:class 3 adenylate cyclase
MPPRQRPSVKLSRADPTAGSSAGQSAGDTGAAAAHRLRKTRPLCSLKMVVSALTAVIVLVVASITFAITYTTGAKSTEDMGASFATSVVDAARIRVEDMFAEPVRQQQALVTQFLHDGYMLPSDDPTDFDVLEKMTQSLEVVTLRRMVAVNNLWFDDGSAIFQTIVSGENASSQVIYLFRSNARFITNSTTKCCSAYRADEYVLPDMTRRTTNPEPRFSLADARGEGFVGAKRFLANTDRGLWMLPTYVDSISPPAYTLPVVMSVRNRTHFLGISALGTSVASITDFLKRLECTPNGQVFVVDVTGTVVSTTYPANIVSLRITTSLTEAQLAPANCATSVNSAKPGATAWTIACRPYFKDFPYAPLRTIAVNHAALTSPTGDDIVLQTVKVDSAAYFVGASKIANEQRAFPLSILVFIPYNDVLGDVIRSRNIAIAAVCCTFVVACAASFLLIHAVLSPLQRVAVHMRQTARLRDVSDDDSLSRLREVHDLQVAFAGMNTAVKSFTRYVPREVVKDLMATGQLCTIQMTPTRCTVLFVDIAGFTTMCERVPTDELSRLVRVYFERMSSMVMTHGGLIDKFIGDCIMAVWGAPFAIGNQETRGALCAAMMERETRVAPLSDEFDAAGESLHVRVGVATGTVRAGNMGTSERMNYTVIGDDVNLAARLESLNKQFNTRVLLAQSTAERVAPVLALRLVHRIRVVGKDAPVEVYELLGLTASKVPPETAFLLRGADFEAAPLADMSMDASSAVSAASSYHSAYGSLSPTRPAVLATTLSLLEAAMRCDDPSLAVSSHALQSAELHSQAVRLFAASNFGSAITLLEELRALVSNGELDLASTTLLQQCENCLRSPPSPDFETVFHPSET